MSKFSKSLAAVAIASAMAASFPAHALTVTFGGANAYQDDVDTLAVDSIAAGKTSSVGGYINAATNTVNSIFSTSVFLETFDAKATGLNSVFAPTRPTDANLSEIQFGGPNGGFDTLNPNTVANGGDLTLTQGGTGANATMGIRKGSTSFAAAPGGVCATAPCNQTYFAYGPGQDGAMPATVNVSYTNLLNVFGPGYQIDYLGVFYGSIDTYNGIRFRNASGNLISGSGALLDGILTGTEILTALGGQSGNQTSPNSNVYLNLFFNASEQFSSFEFYTTGVAVELDNVVTHVGRVPEPASLALFGLSLFGLAGMRRKANQNAK